jgi:hypothetical protein
MSELNFQDWIKKLKLQECYNSFYFVKWGLLTEVIGIVFAQGKDNPPPLSKNYKTSSWHKFEHCITVYVYIF